MQGTSFVVAPTVVHAFFEQAEFERLLRNHLFEILCLATQFLHLVSICSTRNVHSQPLFPASMKSLDHL